MHFTEVIRIAQRAWDATKDKSDPVWNDCDPAHRQKFAAAAQAVIDSGYAASDFERAVGKFAQEVEEKREAIEEVQAERPTSHSDEIQLEAAKRQAAEPVVVVEGASVAQQGLEKDDPTFARLAAEASADAKTLRHSKPTPDDDAEVSAAAKRLSSRKSAGKKSAKKASK